MDKVSNFIKINGSPDSFGREWALEPETKPEIEGFHLQLKDMSN